MQLLLFWELRLRLQRVKQRQMKNPENITNGSGLRFVLALLVGCLSIVGGLSFVFSDLGPGETGLLRVFSGAVFFLGISGLIAFLIPRFWYLALLPSVGPVCMMALLLWVEAPHAHPAFALLIGVGPVAVSVVGGLLGRMFGRRLWRRPRVVTELNSTSERQQ